MAESISRPLLSWLWLSTEKPLFLALSTVSLQGLYCGHGFTRSFKNILVCQVVVVAHTFDPSIREAEACVALLSSRLARSTEWVSRQPELHRETLSWKKYIHGLSRWLCGLSCCQTFLSWNPYGRRELTSKSSPLISTHIMAWVCTCVQTQKCNNFNKNLIQWSWTSYHLPVVPEDEQEDPKFQAGLYYLARPYLKKKNAFQCCFRSMRY